VVQNKFTITITIKNRLEPCA